MKNRQFSIFGIILGVMLLAPSAYAQDSHKKSSTSDIKLESQKNKLSYTLGLEIGDSLKPITESEDIDLNVLFAAIRDRLENKKPRLSLEETNKIKQAFMQRRIKAAKEKRKIAGEENKKKNESFFSANAKKSGVKVTKSGLQYQVIKKGKGPKPKLSDTVKVHYRGTLLDGTEFDSSYKRGQPLTFALQQVIPGWKEGLQLMPVGSKFKLFVPPQLAYGEHGMGKLIPPNAALVFEVELLGIEKEGAKEAKN